MTADSISESAKAEQPAKKMDSAGVAMTLKGEKEAEKEETPKKRKKDLRETAIGRFITKTFCAKSED